MNQTDPVSHLQALNQDQNPLQTQQPACCRICLDIQPRQQLISPCLCKGSTKYVHEPCLMQWANKNQKPVYNEITQSTQLPCQICKHHIPLHKNEKKKLRTCAQVQKAVVEQKGKFIIQFVGIVCLIVCQIYLGFKYPEYRQQNNRLFQNLTLVVVIVLAFMIVGLVYALVVQLMFQIVESYEIRMDYMAMRIDPDSAYYLRNQQQRV